MFSIYPNPAKELLYFNLNTIDLNQSKIEIFDIQVSAAWNRRISAKSLERKKQVVGLDFLAFKNLKNSSRYLWGVL